MGYYDETCKRLEDGGAPYTRTWDSDRRRKCDHCKQFISKGDQYVKHWYVLNWKGFYHPDCALKEAEARCAEEQEYALEFEQKNGISLKDYQRLYRSDGALYLLGNYDSVLRNLHEYSERFKREYDLLPLDLRHFVEKKAKEMLDHLRHYPSRIEWEDVDLSHMK